MHRPNEINGAFQDSSARMLIRRDAQQGGSLAGLRRMPSIDAEIAQQLFGGNIELFESLARRLLNEYADLVVRNLVFIDDGMSFRQELQQRFHKLKGGAGMIGALTVANLAGAAEAALQEDRPVAGIVKKLGRAIITLRDELQEHLEKRSDLTLHADHTGHEHSAIGRVEIEDLAATITRCGSNRTCPRKDP